MLKRIIDTELGPQIMAQHWIQVFDRKDERALRKLCEKYEGAAGSRVNMTDNDTPKEEQGIFVACFVDVSAETEFLKELKTLTI